MSAEERFAELQREHCRQLAQSVVVERPVTEAIEFETSVAKRAQYKAFDVERVEPGISTVQSESHENADEHSHRATVKEHAPVFCASLADTYHGGACKRHVTVAIYGLNLEVAISSEGNREPKIVTDGGRVIEHSLEYEQHTDRRPRDCDCLPTFDDLPCWPCYRDGFRMPNPNVPSNE